MPDIFIYSKQPLEEARQDLEDDLETFLGSAGQCTGGGQGEGGWNIDLEIFRVSDLEACAARIGEFLRRRPVPQDTYLVLWFSPERQSRVDVFPERGEA